METRPASRNLARRYYQKCQEVQSLKGKLHNLRVALLMDIRKLKSHINEEREANQPLKLASTAPLGRHHQPRSQARRDRGQRTLTRRRRKAPLGARKPPHKPIGADAGDYPTPQPTRPSPHPAWGGNGQGHTGRAGRAAFMCCSLWLPPLFTASTRARPLKPTNAGQEEAARPGEGRPP